MIGVDPVLPDVAVAGCSSIDESLDGRSQVGAPNEATMMRILPVLPGGTIAGRLDSPGEINLVRRAKPR
jgi:hypothetical protein